MVVHFLQNFKVKKKIFFEKIFVFFTKYTLFAEKIILYGKKIYIDFLYSFTKKTFFTENENICLI